MKTGAVTFILLFVVGVFFLASWAVMMLGNVVLNHFGGDTLDYTASMAVVGLSMILWGGSRVNSNKS